MRCESTVVWEDRVRAHVSDKITLFTRIKLILGTRFTQLSVATELIVCPGGGGRNETRALSCNLESLVDGIPSTVRSVGEQLTFCALAD